MGKNRILKFKLTGDWGNTMLRVTQFQVTEELSVGCRGTIEVEMQEEMDVAGLVGKKAVLTLQSGEDQAERRFHGVVLEAQLSTYQKDRFKLQITLGSRLELLKLGQNTRMFQKQTVPEVVKAILKEIEIDDSAQTWPTTSYPKRDLITQFNESDFHFITRLLSSEGIAFAVRNKDEDALVFFDDRSGIEALAEDAVLIDQPTTGLAENAMLSFQDRCSAASDQAMLQDYDFCHPALDLSQTEKAPRTTGREVYVHPGNFQRTADGKRLARRTLERLQVGTRVRSGTTSNPFFEPGRTFTLQSHPRAELNGEHLIVAVSHQGSPIEQDPFEGEYTNQFRAIPKDVPFRPSAIDAPIAPGLQVAFVSGPSGQELHGNEHGQVKVRFPWDRSGLVDDRSCTWLRVGQLALPGSMVIPRVGFEVLVDYEMGDIDRPLVVGHVYNGESQPPYKLPGAATKSSMQTATTGGGPGSNELRIEDAAGSEEIFFNASKDFTCSVENDASLTVKVDNSEKVGGDHSFRVGANLSATVVGDRSLKVGANQKVDVGADLADSVGGASQVTVGAVRKLTVGGDLSENTTGTLLRKVGGLQCVTGVGYHRNVVGSSNTTVGGAWMEVCAVSRANICGGRRLETVGGMKLVKAKTVNVQCGTAQIVNAASENVKVGGERVDAADAIVITAGGGLSIQADNINITGETKVVLRVGGSTLELTPSSVKLKSASVDLRGIKKLGSNNNHDSN